MVRKKLQNMYVKTCIALMLVLSFQESTGQATYTWDASAATASGTTGTTTNITMGSFLQGNNNGTTTMITSVSTSTGTGASGGNNFGAAAKTGALVTASGGSAYFQVTVTPATGYSILLSGFSTRYRSTGTGPQALALRTNDDNYASNVATSALNNSSSWALISPTVSGAAASGAVNTPLTIRIYGYNGAGSAGASTANWRIDDISLTVSAISAATAPTVSTAAASSLLTNSATLGGSVSATGGATISGTGNVYALTSVNSNPQLLGTGVTQLATGTPAAGTGSFSNNTGTGLAANSQYSNRAYAKNSVGTSYGSTTTFYTRANMPGTPTVGNPTSASLDITLDVAGNPANTQFAIMEASGLYVQIDGSLGVSPVFQTLTLWGSITVGELASSTSYSFSVAAKNGAGVVTAYGTAASGATLSQSSPMATPTSLPSFGQVCIGSSVSHSFLLSGSNLDGSAILLGALDGFTYSDAEEGIYTSTVAVTYTGDSFSGQEIWVKFSPLAEGLNEGTITLSGGGLGDGFGVPVSGNGVATPVEVTNGSSSAVTSISATLSATLSQGCTLVTNYGFELSTTNNFTNGSGTSYTAVNLNEGSYSTNVAELSPNTTYYFKSFATDSSGVVYGEQQSFVTLGLGTPNATAATTVGYDNFTANWDILDGATSYRLDVSTSPTFETIGTTSLSETFDSYTNAASLNGFTFSGTSNYTSDQSSGVGPNSVQFNSTGDQMTSPVLSGNATSLSFWLKGNSTDAASALLVEGYNGSTWVTIQNITGSIPTAIDGVTITFNSGSSPALPSNITQFRLTYTKSIGNVAFDDFSASYSATNSFFVAGYENLLVNGNSQLVSGLDENTNYYYRVRGVSANSVSVNSNTIAVLTGTSPTTFGSISQNAPVCDGTQATFSVTGLVPNSESTIAYTIGSSPEMIVEDIIADENGNGEFMLPLTTSNNGETLTITLIERTDEDTEAVAVTSNNTVILAVYAVSTFYADADGDGYGNALVSQTGCVQPNGFVTNNLDCDDNNVDANPGEIGEILYNGFDDDCSGTIDDGFQITTQNYNQYCGITQTQIYHGIAVNYMIPNITRYRFRVMNMTNPAEAVQYLERGYSSFALTELPQYHYGTKYSVATELQRNGIWLGYYGNECEITTPPVPQLQNCGGVIPAKGTLIFSQVKLKITGYRFEVMRLSDGTITEINNGSHYFSFNMVPEFAAGEAYSVKISVKTTSYWSEFGTACVINAPGQQQGAPAKNNVKSFEQFTVVAYPNPYTEVFMLNANTSSDEEMTIRVYDMTGRMLDSRTIAAESINSQLLGSSYPTGVYNLVVTQGEAVKTLRVIKR